MFPGLHAHDSALPLCLSLLQNNVPYHVPGYRSVISGQLEEAGLSDEDGAVAIQKVRASTSLPGCLPCPCRGLTKESDKGGPLYGGAKEGVALAYMPWPYGLHRALWQQ
jgi:hypothetical protein